MEIADVIRVSVCEKYCVKTIDTAMLKAWLTESSERIVYIFDAREKAEYAV